MLWNVGTIVRQEMQGAAVPIEGAPSVVKSHELAMGSPAFDAWLQAYRKRLEEACQRAHSRPASPANQTVDYIPMPASLDQFAKPVV